MAPRIEDVVEAEKLRGLRILMLSLPAGVLLFAGIILFQHANGDFIDAVDGQQAQMLKTLSVVRCAPRRASRSPRSSRSCLRDPFAVCYTRCEMACEFTLARRVEFFETDMGGIVHFVNFYRWMESAEHAFYRSLGLGIHDRKGGKVIGWPRVAASCEFKAPLRFEDEMEVHLLVTEKGVKSLTHTFIFRKVEGEKRSEVARGTMTVVSVALDPVSGSIKSVPLPKEFDEKIEVAPSCR